MYIKGLVNTKHQSNACMCDPDVEGVERSLNSSSLLLMSKDYIMLHNIDTCQYYESKGSKDVMLC